ncbi:hypothetical protein GCM10023091_24430 [Ravibacter arvi]|uniref:2'-5' RNA ligase n=1 Tax=Ravibacter arvi TaxID=2051041 RepID=A0ABP8LYQ8_9BACT
MTDQCIAFNRLHYYSYLIMPHGVIDCVAEWQRRFVKMFGFRNATVKLPHLSFSNWSMSPHCERRLFDLLEARCRVVKPLNVKLTGFDDLNGGAFCFMVAQGKQCFDRVIDDKGKWRRDFKMVGGVRGVEFTENLHVTIAKGLTQAQCGVVRKAWEGQHFEMAFPVEGLRLLRESGRGKKFLRDFRFEGYPKPPPAPGYGNQLPLF